MVQYGCVNKLSWDSNRDYTFDIHATDTHSNTVTYWLYRQCADKHCRAQRVSVAVATAGKVHYSLQGPSYQPSGNLPAAHTPAQLCA